MHYMGIKCVPDRSGWASERERHRDRLRMKQKKIGRIKDDHKRRNKQDATQSNST